MHKVLSIVSSLVAVACLVLASANFARLQVRPVAPSLGDYALYVGFPGVICVSAGVLVAFAVVPTVINPDRRPPTSPPAREPAVNPPPNPPSALEQHGTVNPSPGEQRDLGRIWSIIDELADALRGDEDGSEAVFVIRERYHRLKFGWTPEQEAKPIVPKPTKQSVAV